jgi:hypothetical protein
MTQIQRNSAVEYGNRELPEKLLCCPSSHGESKSILVDPQTPRRRGRGNADLILRAATQVASGRSLKRHSPKVRAEFTVPTELRKSFEFHRQLLIPRSRNCKFVRATSKSIRTVYPLAGNTNSANYAKTPITDQPISTAFSSTYEWHSVCIGKRASWT